MSAASAMKPSLIYLYVEIVCVCYFLAVFVIVFDLFGALVIILTNIVNGTDWSSERYYMPII